MVQDLRVKVLVQVEEWDVAAAEEEWAEQVPGLDLVATVCARRAELFLLTDCPKCGTKMVKQ